jgi:hypothetical protein
LALLVYRTSKTRPRRFWVNARLDQRNFAFNARDPFQVFGNQSRLPRALRRERGVLEVAAPTTARVGIGTRRRHTLGTGFKDLDRVTAGKTGRLIGHLNHDQFARQCVAHEDNSTIVDASDATASRRTLDSNWADNLVNYLVLHHCSLLTKNFFTLWCSQQNKGTCSND